MRNASRSTASQLVAAGLAACMWLLWPAAQGETPSGTLDRGPEAAPKRGGDVAQGIRADRICTRLFDGRGEKVLVQRPGREAAPSAASGCRANDVAPKPAEVNTPVSTEASPEVKAVKPIPSKPKLANPKVTPITAGAVQVDRASSRDRQADPPIALRVSAGRLSATLLTGGTAVFLLQSSLWTYLLMLGLPLWQHVDLLPIVDTAEDTTGASSADADDEQAVTHVLDAQGRVTSEGRT